MKYPLFFILFTSFTFAFEAKLYKIDFQMEEAARQIRLEDTPLEKFKNPNDAVVVFWDDEDKFIKMVEVVNLLLNKTSKNIIGIFKGPDTTALKRVKVYINNEYIKNDQELKKFVMNHTHYFDADGAAEDLKIFKGSSPSIIIYNKLGEVEKRLVSAEEIRDYIQQITALPQTDQSSESRQQ